MKPPVFRPNIASRFFCSIGRRTSAWVPLMNARPCSRLYLSSRVTLSSALRTESGRGAFIEGSDSEEKLLPVLPVQPGNRPHFDSVGTRRRRCDDGSLAQD